PAGAGPGRVAALDHEVGDHAVEDDAVVEPVARELEEVLDGLRRLLVEELDCDRAVVGVQGRVGHLANPLSASSAAAWSKRSIADWVPSHSASSARPSSRATSASKPRCSRPRETSAKQWRTSPARKVSATSGSMSLPRRLARVRASSKTLTLRPLAMLTASPPASLSSPRRKARATSVTWSKSRNCSP